MIQILYNKDSLENERITSVREVVENQNSYQRPMQKRSKITSAKGMIGISLLLIITVCTILLIGLGAWNVTSEAVSQEEVVLCQLPGVSKNIQQLSKQAVLAIEENILTEAKVAIKEVVVKKAIASDGKAYDTVAYLTIPSLGIQYPVLAKTSEALLKVSLNKYWGSNPNQVGNMCIVGHNYNDDRFFGKLNQIEQGAEIIITEMDGEALSYYVYKTDMIDPYDTSCTSQRTNGGKEITLITCNVDGSQRFIAKARANE